MHHRRRSGWHLPGTFVSLHTFLAPVHPKLFYPLVDIAGSKNQPTTEPEHRQGIGLLEKPGQMAQRDTEIFAACSRVRYFSICPPYALYEYTLTQAAQRERGSDFGLSDFTVDFR